MQNQQQTFYVTTPIYYVNDNPHIGHAYTTLLADVLARYSRLLRRPTFFLTGTDEHGQKVDQAAAKRGIPPQQHCDEMVVRFQRLWEKLEVTHDDFIRTTEPRHKDVVQAILQDLYDRDEIYQADYEGWYCVPCERFFTDKDLQEGNCPECRRPVQKIAESAWYFRMSRYQDWLVAHINDHPEFIQPDFRRNETLGFLRQPLGDLCISRPKSRLSWGIEMPFDPDYVCYVWFDALVNYISAVGYKRDDDEFAKWWPASYHLIGKDILTTHTVYWPTMLKAMGVPMPRTIFAHGWWLTASADAPEAEGEKMSKSKGNVVDPMQLCDRYGIDAFRYFLMAEMSLGHDSNFSEPMFVERYNSDLAGNVGNMLSRVLKMVHKHFDGCLPAAGPPDDVDTRLQADVLQSVDSMRRAIDTMTLNRGLADVIAAVKACNRYFEETRPWALAKDDGDRDRLATVLYQAAEGLRVISGLLLPVMPAKMTAMRQALGIDPDEAESPRIDQLEQWGQLVAGAAVADIKPLFPRAEMPPADADAAADKKKPGKKAKKPTDATAAENVVDTISIDDFKAFDLRTARIVEAEPHPDADRLLKLQVEVAGERRQLVAGIADWYAPDALVGKTIVIVANLKPARIRGVESQGMLLAATQGKKKLTLITLDNPEFATGAQVG